MDKSENETVFLHYGPYEANYIIRHKLQRLFGIMGALKQLEIPYSAIPSPKLNRLEVIIGDCLVTSCDIRNLKFNVRAEDDKICRRILKYMKEHFQLLKEERLTSFPKSIKQDSHSSVVDTAHKVEDVLVLQKPLDISLSTDEAYAKYIQFCKQLIRRTPKATKRSIGESFDDIGLEGVEFKICKRSICSQCDGEKQPSKLKIENTYSSLYGQSTNDAFISPTTVTSTPKPTTIATTSTLLNEQLAEKVASKSSSPSDIISIMIPRQLDMSSSTVTNIIENYKDGISLSHASEQSVVLQVHDYNQFLCPVSSMDTKKMVVPKHYMTPRISNDIITKKYCPRIIEKSGLAVHELLKTQSSQDMSLTFGGGGKRLTNEKQSKPSTFVKHKF